MNCHISPLSIKPPYTFIQAQTIPISISRPMKQSALPTRTKTMMVMIFLVAKFALVITSSISSLAHTFSPSTRV